ncbi:hypothetical protein BH10PSE7_BH10PSE7_11860 [soil metagenome]
MRDIVSERLILRLLPVAALKAGVAGDLARMSSAVGCTVPPSWNELAWLAAMRLEQLRADPAYLAWSIRAIILRESQEIAGYVNFHERPGVHGFTGTKNTVEFGYAILGPFRRRGFAEETVRRLIDWARSRAAENFVFSISPGNAASLALARKLGARKIGTQTDERDGPEDVYLLVRPWDISQGS